MTAPDRRAGPVRLVTGVSLAVCLAAGLAPGVAAQASGDPEAYVGKPVVDLGTVRVGDVAEAIFEVENRGDGPLRIVSADTGCACTVAEYDETVAAGKTGTVRASLITAQLTGSVIKGVVLRTNDPRRPRVHLTLKATVVGSVKLLPQPVVIMRRREGVAMGRLLVRKDPSETGRLEIDTLETSENWLTARGERLDAPRARGGGLPAGQAGDWIVEVRFADDVTVFGERSATLTFRTGLTRQPELLVEVESSFVAPVRFSTSKLVLAPDGSGGARGTLFASVREGLDPSALVVRATPSGLTARLEPATGRLVQVEVRWNGGALEGGKVTFRIGEDAVDIPVETAAP